MSTSLTIMEMVYIQNYPLGNIYYSIPYSSYCRLSIEERADSQIYFDVLNNCISCKTD